MQLGIFVEYADMVTLRPRATIDDYKLAIDTYY